MPYSRSAPRRTKRGVPVLLPDGTTRISLAALARELGCRPGSLVPRIIAHQGGYAVLGSLPDPRNVGRHGGRRARSG